MKKLLIGILALASASVFADFDENLSLISKSSLNAPSRCVLQLAWAELQAAQPNLSIKNLNVNAIRSSYSLFSKVTDDSILAEDRTTQLFNITGNIIDSYRDISPIYGYVTVDFNNTEGTSGHIKSKCKVHITNNHTLQGTIVVKEIRIRQDSARSGRILIGHPI